MSDERVQAWAARAERRVAHVEAWLVRQMDRYECFLERWHWSSRRGYVTSLRRQADEIEHLWPRKAARLRRKADAAEREGLEVALRMDPAERKDDQ